MEDTIEIFNDEIQTVVSVSDYSTAVRLYRCWRYSREEISREIKTCQYKRYSFGGKVTKVYWMGEKYKRISRMLHETELHVEAGITFIENESNVYCVPRLSLWKCCFFTPECLSFLLEKQGREIHTPGSFIEWEGLHRVFYQDNRMEKEISLNREIKGLLREFMQDNPLLGGINI